MKRNMIMAAALAAAFAGVPSRPLVAQSRAPKTLSDFQTAQRIAEQRLKTFDTLDFDVFSNQQWDRIRESHSPDIVVYWPDGHSTRGVERHIEDMKYMFSYAPDTRIKEHPIKVAQGEWASVVGILEGTFTKPMTLPDGTVIQPTGKAFKIRMATVGHWNSAGVMTEEYLFWDNKAYMDQIGLGK